LPWSSPINLGPIVNSTADDRGTALSPSRTSLYFFSNRTSTLGGVDLYEITRSKLPGPTISANGVVSAFTYAAEPLTQNSLVSIFGTNLAHGTAQGQLLGGGFSSYLGGVRVSFNFAGGRMDAPLLYISPLQINAQVPSGLPPGGANVTVTVDDATSVPQAVTIQ
jgi:hypothetical protein